MALQDIKSGLLFLIFLFSIFPVSAQQEIHTQTIRGTVKDLHSQSPLFGATIMVLNSNPLLGATVNENGNFRLEKVPVGRQQIKVTYVGYKEVIIPVLLTSGKELVLEIELEESFIEAQEVVIKSEKDKSRPNNEMSIVSARAFDVEEANRYAGSRNDAARMVANYAGVVGGNDSRNDIIIRGNSPSGLLRRLEDIDIPNPNHFAIMGSTGGPVGMLNTNVLAKSDFMTGAFTANYTNALSGVFDLKLRNGNNEKHEFLAQAGFNGFEGGAEGPINIKNGSSYLVNYRYSTLKVLQMLGVNFGTGTGVPYYQDGSFKINIPVKNGIVNVFGLGGISTITIKDSENPKKLNSFVSGGRDVVSGSGMGVSGASYTHFINPKAYSKFTLSATYENNTENVDTLDVNMKPHNSLNVSNSRSRYTANYFVSKKFSSRLATKSGVTADLMHFDLQRERYFSHISTYQKMLQSNGNAWLGRAYSQWSYKITPSISFNPGLSIMYFQLNNKISAEPRAGFSWDVSEKKRLSFGYGLHSRLQELPLYFYETGNLQTNKNLGFSKAQQFVAGYDWKIKENLRIKAETYYQQLFNIPVEQGPTYFSTLNNGAEFTLPLVDSLENNGTGENYGLELTLEKFFSKGYYYLFTGSLFQSTYKGSDGILRNTAFNGNTIFNALAGKEFKLKENLTLALDFRTTYAGGRRYIPIDLEKSKVQKEQVYNFSEAYKDQLPDYFRLDGRLTLRINSKKSSQEIAFYIENITNHKNVFNYRYDVDNQEVVYVYQLGLFPLGHYRINF